MKVILLLALCAFAVASEDIFDSDPNHIHGENGWYVPQLDGSFVWMDKDEAEKWLEDMEKLEDDVANNQDLDEVIENRGVSSITDPVTFYLYTKSNPTTAQKIDASEKSIKASHFNPSHPTRFVIHGWTQSYKADMNNDIRNAWLSVGEHNIIVVDWARARSVEYASSVLAVPTAGKKVAAMVDYLVKSHGMKLDTLYVIGHSLGAHVAGYTGKNVKSGEVHTIIGLDPALPLFSYNKPEKRLSSTDGHYVESIQTNGGKLGFLKPIGKGAFYPNGGKKQPGCGVDLTGGCSHGRSTIYYAEAVRKNNFPSMKCSDYEKAVDKDCGATYSSVRMGADSNAYMVAGDFYVPVKAEAPWGMGA